MRADLVSTAVKRSCEELIGKQLSDPSCRSFLYSCQGQVAAVPMVRDATLWDESLGTTLHRPGDNPRFIEAQGVVRWTGIAPIRGT